MLFSTPAWDNALSLYVRESLKCPFLDHLVPLLSDRTLLWIVGVAVFAWLFRDGGLRRVLPVIFILLAVGATDLTSNAIKKSVNRLRPPQVEQLYGSLEAASTSHLIHTESKGKSYPSSHAANSMAVAFSAMLLWPGLRPWMLLLPLAVGFSRIYLAKHFPTDVLAGWTLGLAVSGCVISVLSTPAANQLALRLADRGARIPDFLRGRKASTPMPHLTPLAPPAPETAGRDESQAASQ